VLIIVDRCCVTHAYFCKKGNLIFRRSETLGKNLSSRKRHSRSLLWTTGRAMY